MKTTLVCVVGLLGSLISNGIFAQTAEDRAKELLVQMTMEEKFAMLHGHNGVYVGNIVGNDRLGIPSINMQDGPQGFRVTTTTGKQGSTTAWPSALTVASSWDQSLVYRWGSAMAQEFKGKGANVALAPGIGLARVPTAGRNFEYLCGEDPVLGSLLAKQAITGIQDQGIIANAKHWVNNEIEDQRMLVSANVNERVRFELYYPPFEAAIDAGVLSVMCSYNRINDVYACQNNETLGHLRNELGFKGWVMSDWTATHSTVASIKAGLDQEMPTGVYFRETAIQSALDNGELTTEDIDNSILRILTSMYTIGLFDNAPVGEPTANVTSPEHSALARELAAKSAVLLKNVDEILPLTSAGISQCIAVFGDQDTVSGGGSGKVTPGYVVTPAQGIAAVLDGTGKSVLYNSGSDLSAAADLAAKCDVAIVVVATSSCEGYDRSSLSLENGQDELVNAIVAANKNTVVVVNTPGAVLMPWSESVPAIVVMWLPGQEAGNALADILFGSVNPSGRLPVTMPNKENEVGFTKSEYPGIGLMPEAAYNEELLVGYRWYDANNVVAKFPFGHGLSYTHFSYTKAMASSRDALIPGAKKQPMKDDKLVTVSVTIANDGKRQGAEVVQLYLGFPSGVGEPPKLLKSFQKVELDENQVQSVEFSLSSRDMSIWCEKMKAWKLVTGEFQVFIGASSADIRAETSFTI